MNDEELKEVLEEAEDLANDFKGGYFNYRMIEKEEHRSSGSRRQ